MKLRNKLLLSQIVVFLFVFMILAIALPNIVFWSAKKADVENSMNFNEQIMMRIDRCFEELERFSKVVAGDEDLNLLLKEYREMPSQKTEAKIRLYLSNMGNTDGVAPYQTLGIYINVSDSLGDLAFHTVGLSESVKKHVVNQVLPRYEERGARKMFLSPFSFTPGETSAVFGSTFTMGYGYTCPYSKNGISGSVTLISSFDEITFIVKDVKEYSKDFVLLTEDNKAVKPSVADSRIKVEETLKNMEYGDSYFEGYYYDDQGVCTVRLSEYGNWKLITRLTKHDIIANNRSVIWFDELLIGIFGIGIMLIMVPFVRRFTKPLGEVAEQMGEISNGNLDARVTVKSQDEIGEVCKAFNTMAVKLDDNIKALLEKEKTEQTLRYSLLISQVDPHFIYNTMNTITYLAQKGRNEDVIQVNRAMIEILRDRLRIEISEVYDYVQQEVSVVKQYLIIQRYRYEGTFKANFLIEEAAKDCLIAKNILQPLVENALFHGIFTNRDENGELLGGCITIRAERQEALLVVSVCDNGAGMSEEQVEHLCNQPKAKIRGVHIGLRNIRERINYIYGEAYNIDIRSKLGEGTCVTLKLPVIEEIQEQR